ncbi:MAG: hypothetical protein M1830_008510 [Pleopsidium flavum]|nr:MAG: hypothetical protein M1830_008510 [Pleopsidium flavum]
MASTRPMRKSSRMSSPLDVSMKVSATPPNEQAKKERKTFMDSWVEPPLRNPAPSFEDYKGLERHGVLEHMAPLGSLPTQKVKLRVKGEAPKRLMQVKNGDAAAAAKEGVRTPEALPTVTTRRSESRKAEDRPPKIPPSRENEEDDDYTPKGSTKAPGRAASVKVTPTQNSLHGTPNSRTPAGRARLETVVNSAVARSYEIGNPVLGLAVKKLFDESLGNRTLADLLDAVLSQRPTARQAADFQAYIKVARKQIKAQNSARDTPRRSSGVGIGSSSKSSSKSPSKSVRPGAAGEIRMSKEEATPSHPPNSNLDSLSKNNLLNGKLPETNGMASRDGRSLKRSRSSSSTSSLSSLSSIDQTFAPSMETDHANIAETHATHQPMTASKAQASLGPKLHTFSTTNLTTNNSHKRTSAAAGLTNNDVEEVAAKRAKLQKTFEDYTVNESSIRVDPAVGEPAFSKPSLSLSAHKHQTRLRNGTGKRIARDECDDLESPSSSAPGDLLVPPPPGAQLHSRSGTPSQFGRPSKQVKKAARIKMSPIKKKSGVIAGIARAGGGRDSPVGYGTMDDNEEHENNDYCSACGGSGQLLCCDGCARSFHFTCLDPPMDPNQPPEGQWFCFICESKRDPRPKPPRGLFAVLLATLEKKNPVAYNLPFEIRDYFEGVKTGEEGEYEEAVTLKTRTRAGYDETPDLLKLRDSKGKFVLCFRCGKSSLNHQEIIPCDFCNLQWHLDCLDPPMANPPVRGSSGKPRHSWMCPNHVEHELAALDSSVMTSSRSQILKGNGRTHKVRRPKNAKIVDTALRRGFVNNGLIEIENEASDDEEFFEREQLGVVYRLPERGVKLDFIDRVKRSWLESQPIIQHQTHTLVSRAVEQKLRAAAQAQAEKKDFQKRPFVERKAALNLAQFAQQNQDLNISSDQVENLVDTLIAEAPSEVVALCTETSNPNITKDPSIPPSPPASDQPEHGISQKERDALMIIQELIRRRLDGSTTAS